MIADIAAKIILDRFHAQCRDMEKSYANTWRKLAPLLPAAPAAGLAALRGLPFTDYTSYREQVEMSIRQKRNLLNGEKIGFLIKSTGSTSKPNYFPLTKSYRKSLLRHLMVRSALLHRHQRIYSSGTDHFFFIPGKHSVSGIPAGHMGLFLYNMNPTGWKSAVPKRTANDEAAFYKYGDILALLKPLRSISGTIPVGLNAFLERVRSRRVEIMELLRQPDTTLRGLIDIRSLVRRRDRVIAALDHHTITPAAFWPELEFFCFWKSGACGRQLPLIQPHIPANVPVLDQVYIASEGAFNVPFPGGNGGPVHPSSIILEFLDTASGKIYWPWEIEAGKTYELVLTNFMGLLRYRIGDLVECTGFYGSSPKIHFAGRVHNELSLGWKTFPLTEMENFLLQSGIDLSGVLVGPTRIHQGFAVYHTGVYAEPVVRALSDFLLKNVDDYGRRVGDGTLKPVISSHVPEALFFPWKNNSKSIVLKTLPDWMYDATI